MQESPRPSAADEVSWADIERWFVPPQWYSSARLGIWAHWGAQSQPGRGGGWYGRHLYMPDPGPEQWGAAAHTFHTEVFGHPSRAGFKDVAHAWNAEKFDADGLIQYFASTLGARFFLALANHHDHFDNWDSRHHAWNSVRVGPRRDLIGEWAAAARRADLPFGVSVHDDRMEMYFEHAFDADTEGALAGVGYDGNHTLADGVGTWWEGLDPADLYGPPPSARNGWRDRMLEQWLLRHTELIERYDPDLVWFDGYGYPYDEVGRELVRRFYARDLTAHPVRPERCVVGKVDEDPAIIDDVERGVAAEIRDRVWQSSTTFTGWFYQEDMVPRHDARTLAQVLIDVASKNGNLVLNVELTGSGLIPPGHREILDRFGHWVQRNRAAVFGTTPWTVHGDNLAVSTPAGKADNADLAALEDHSDGHFTERTVASEPYPPDEVRFTHGGGRLFVTVLDPAPGWISLASLGTGGPAQPFRVSRAVRLDGGERVRFEQRHADLRLELPADATGMPVVVVLD